ncbi:MAG: sporulation protein YunB [Firmicutes bacterium]|nr:sporulation protein YunB [Bacillota bacterium]
MEYCVPYNRCKNRPEKSKKYRKRKRIIISLSIVMAIITLLLVQYFVFAVPTVRLVSEQRIRALAVLAVEDAAQNTFTAEFSHKDFVDITRDNDGNILLLQANTMLIHALTRNAVELAHKNLTYIEESGITVPLGAFFGAAILAGYGPDIQLRVLSVGIMASNLHSEFISAGINQTLHRITLNLMAEVTLIMPGLQSVVRNNIQVPITESTIIGRVPDVFLNTDIFNRSLNLVP